MDQVLRSFFDPEHFAASIGPVLRGFTVNLQLMVLAEALVLVWALVLALMRTAPGPLAFPLRLIAAVYTDIFRGVPLLVVIFLVGFGLPTTGVPPFRGMDPFFLGMIALVLVYGAYVAEVYRAGIDSVHPSQVAAARALGLSYRKAMRFVILPQAVRRVIPPLLNDFIGLQKDTALVSVIGITEGTRQAGLYAGVHFNATSYIGVALCFVLVTVPMTRLVDVLIARDRGSRAGGLPGRSRRVAGSTP